MKIRRIYIDDDAVDDSVAEQVCRRIGLPVKRVNHPVEIYQQISASPDPEAAGKSVLLLTRNKGRFIRNCPGTTHYTCCGYQILHVGAYCSMDCAYCILQAYYHPPVLHFFTNHDQMHEELQSFFDQGIVGRIGTGEFTDSLIWEPLFPLARQLVERFSHQDTGILELKTKTAAVDGLLALSHNRKTIMAWSLNTQTVIKHQERATAGLSARIAAAEKCQARGYRLAFHFDPMILYPGCYADYEAVVQRLFARIDPAKIVWISIGSFRFMPELKEVIARRFPDSRIIYGEFIKAMDGKMRYFKPLRIGLYRHLIASIRANAPDVLIYFCMEDDEVWEKALGFTPAAHGGLARMLDERAASMCDLNGRVQTR